MHIVEHRMKNCYNMAESVEIALLISKSIATACADNCFHNCTYNPYRTSLRDEGRENIVNVENGYGGRYG